MAIALLAKLRSLHTAAIQYPYIVITLPRIIAISSHTYVSRTVRLEPALTYLRSVHMLWFTVRYEHVHMHRASEIQTNRVPLYLERAWTSPTLMCWMEGVSVCQRISWVCCIVMSAQICCRLYCYECAARVTMTATSEWYFSIIASIMILSY